jgi:hypothetical protein
MGTNNRPVISNCRTDSPQPPNRTQFDIYRFTRGRDQEKAYVNYQADPLIYDSGKRLTVVYLRIENDPDALESRLLNCQNLRAKNVALLEILDETLPHISHLYPTVTRITLNTVNGNLTTIVTEDVKEITHYFPVPIDFSHIPTVPITDLQKVSSLSMDVDRVKWQGETWAFKLTGENLEGTLRELAILDQLSDSPYIIKLNSIVTNRDNTIRGFLTPFMPHGDLASVLDMERTNRGLTDDCETMAFDWSLKLSWARQITRGVVDLHAISAYNGDLKPRNVLLDAAGQAILVDFCPMGCTDDFAAPEILQKLSDPETVFESLLTAAADIYSLGLVLYAVAEEKSTIALPLVWRGGQTPKWYEDTIQRCLVEEPGDRPSAAQLLCFLDEERS